MIFLASESEANDEQNENFVEVIDQNSNDHIDGQVVVDNDDLNAIAMYVATIERLVALPSPPQVIEVGQVTDNNAGIIVIDDAPNERTENNASESNADNGSNTLELSDSQLTPSRRKRKR